MATLWRLNLLLIAVVLTPKASGAQEPAWTPATVVAKSSFKEPGDPITLPVMIAGKEYFFLVSTALDATKIDRDLVAGQKLIGEREFNGGDGKSPMLKVFEAPEMYFGDTRLRHLKFVEAGGFADLSKQVGVEVHGILGVDALYPYRLHIDPDHCQVHVSVIASDNRPPGNSVSIALDKMLRPRLLVSLSSTSQELFFIDTLLFATGTLQGSTFDELSKSGTGVTSGVIRLREVKIGNDRQESIDLQRATANMLGLDFFLRYRTTFEFKHDRVYLMNSKNFSARSRAFNDGLNFAEPFDGAITLVTPGSASEAMGFKAGDHLLSVDGAPATASHLFTSRRLTAPNLKDVVAVVDRGGQRLEIKLPNMLEK